MAIMYNNQGVDERYSDKLEANLYFASVLVPGVTCSDDYVDGPASGVYVVKPNFTPAEPGVPGRDFEDEAEELMKISLGNNFQRSRKVYGAQVGSVSDDLRDQSLAAAQRDVQSGWASAGVACLVNEGTADADATAPTVDNAKELVVNARTAIIQQGAVPDVVLCAPSFYALILKTAGKEFLPVTNERMSATGNVGMYLGMTWVEAPALAQASGKYYDYTDTLQTVDFSKVDFAVYPHEMLSAVTNFETARLVDSEEFMGVKAQVELNSGFRVRDAALCVVHKHA